MEEEEEYEHNIYGTTSVMAPRIINNTGYATFWFIYGHHCVSYESSLSLY